LINFSTVKVSGYDVIRWIENFFPFVFCTKNSSIDIITGNFDSEKVDQDDFFYYKDTLHFFLEWPKYYTYQKSYLGFILTSGWNCCSVLVWQYGQLSPFSQLVGSPHSSPCFTLGHGVDLEIPEKISRNDLFQFFIICNKH
jgi:hypothetical protein